MEGASVRIVHLTSSLAVEAGGLSRAVMDSAYALALLGERVDLISYKHGTLDFPWKNAPPPGMEVTLCSTDRHTRFATPDMKAELGKRLRDADVLHLHGMWEPLNAAAAKIARALGKPYVCSIHGMLDPWSVGQRRFRKSLYFSLVERGRLARAGAIHFTADEELRKADTGGWVPQGTRRVVIPVIMDLEPYRNLPPRDAAHAFFPEVPAGAPWILFLSRIHEKKGLDLLISALTQPETSAAHLVIAGTGDEHYVAGLKAQAKSLGISERVHFVGMVQGAKKVALYRRAQMLAIPTSQENFGMVFPEALACETPVLLTSGVDPYREILACEGGVLIERDVRDIAQKIGALLANPAEGQRRGEKGRKWVFDTLEPSAIARRWVETYRSLVQPG